MQQYCGTCGTRLKEQARFCQSCGAPVAQRTIPGTPYAAHYEVVVPRPVPPRPLPFSCILAYIPGLFWLPLVADRGDNTHRECANQGLILSFLTVVLGLVTALIGSLLLHYGALDPAAIKGLFLGLNAANWLSRLPAIIGWAALAALVMYVPVNCMCGFFHGLGSDNPYRVSFFGKWCLIAPHK